MQPATVHVPGILGGMTATSIDEMSARADVRIRTVSGTRLRPGSTDPKARDYDNVLRVEIEFVHRHVQASAGSGASV